MDIFTLNSNFRKIDIIDTFKSIVWTERYSAAGDFVLDLPYNKENQDMINAATFLAIPESSDVMIIETQQIKDHILTVQGPSVTAFLLQRMLRRTGLNDVLYWEELGTPGAIMSDIVFQMCGVGGYMDLDAAIPSGETEVLPNLVIGPAAAGFSVTLAIKYGQVYDGIKAIADTYALGFKLYPDNVTAVDYDLIFTSYAGLNRTSGQSTNGVVIFSPALDSLGSTSELRSIKGYKTAAWAWATNINSGSPIIGSAFVPGTEAFTGFARRTLLVDAGDINANDIAGDGGASLLAMLNQRAADALANNNYVRLLDGEIIPQSEFVYGTDYGMGDVIELRGYSGISQYARITEYIRSEDASGARAYPTLSVIS